MSHVRPLRASPTFEDANADLDALLPSLASEFAARAAAHDRDGSFPVENFARLHETALLGLTVPRDYGGRDVDLATAARVIRAVGAADAATGLVLTMQFLQLRHVGQSVSWPEALRARLFREVLGHGALVNALRVEPELGTPARGGLPLTTARTVPGGWKISGRKIYSTGAPLLSWFVVWGRTDEPEPRVGSFLVPRVAAGISIVETWDHLGMRASGSHDVVLDDVYIPQDHAVDLRAPADWAGGPAGDQMAWMTALLSTLYDAVAGAARDWIAGFATRRVPANLGAPLSSLPRFQEALGRIEALLWTNRIVIDDLIRRTDRAEAPGPIETNLAKYVVANNAIEAVSEALQLAGNHGLSRHNPLERHYRDVLCSRIHTPQNDMVLSAAGRAAFAAVQPAL